MKNFNQRRRRPAAKTSWEGVSDWYGGHLKESDSLLNSVVYPAALKALGDLRGKSLLDIACGEGAFTRLASAAGAQTAGFDAAPSLIERAKRAGHGGRYFVADAEGFAQGLNGEKFDASACLLAVQNFRNPGKAIAEAGKAMEPGGALVIVMNHPAFRIPRQSSWGWEPERQIQYRRVDMYLSELNVPIVAHPGERRSAKTFSHHRSLSFFVNALGRAGFGIVGAEELISNRESDSGPRARAENRARREIPMFLLLKAVKL